MSAGSEPVDWRYESFTSLASWRTARVDDALWTSTLDRLRTAQGSQPESVRNEEIQGSLRAAALNTGAIEGLHNADRGLTVTVVNDAAWQLAVERAEGPAARSFMEAALEAFDLVFDVATNDRPLSEALIRRVHEVVTGPQLTYVAHTAIGRQDVPLPRGTYETLPNHVIEPDGTPHAYAPPDIVSTEMHRLVTELSADDGTTHPLVMAAFAHHAFVAVHPFADGNGRVARLLASIYTMRAASVPLMIWSDQSVEYRAALKWADAGDPQPFVDFVFDRTIDAISLMTDRLRARSAETAIGDEEARAIAEEAQISAAARLWSTIERELVGIVAERPGQLAADHQELTFAGGGVEFPYGQAHRVVATRGAVSSARTFVVWCPRGRTDVVVVATDLHGERREFRVADIEPQLKTAAAEQARAYLRRVTLELLASMDR